MPAGFPATSAVTASANVDWGTLYLADATGGAIVLTLPLVATGRAPILLKKTDSGGNSVKFVTSDGSTIDGGSGATGVSTTTQNAVISLLCDGANWSATSNAGGGGVSLSVANTWTATQTFSTAARSSGSAAYHVVNAPADTALTASTEAIGVSFVGATRQHATGALTTQREYVFAAPTYSFVGASTITTAATVAIAGPPVSGTNATITNPYALLVQSGVVGIPNGAVSAPSLVLGTTATSGFYANGGTSVFLAYSGVRRWEFDLANVTIHNDATGAIVWSNTGGDASATPDAGITRAAAGVLAANLGSNFGSAKCWLQNSAGRSRNTADATNATATMANLSDLSITLIAGRKYTGRLVLFANNSTAAEGLAFDFDGGNATMTSFKAGFAATPPGSGLVLGTLTSTAIATDLTATTATTGDAVYTIEIAMVVNAGGTFIPRFSEVSHAAGTATVRLGSYLWLEDMPN